LRLQTDYSGKPFEATILRANGAISKALELDPNLAEAWAAKGGIAMSRADSEAAERLLRRAIELNPSYVQAHHWLSMVLRYNGSLKEDLEHSERAAQLDPLSVIAQANLGSSMEFVGRYDEAAARYRRAIDIDPMSSVTFYGLALLDAYARNRFPNAVALQERAVALDSGSPMLYSWLAAIYLDMGDTQRAQQVVASLIERWPDDFNSNVAAAVLHQVLGSTAAAERHASKAQAIYSQDIFSLKVLRNADLRRGDPGSARARYASVFPELLTSTPPRISALNHAAAIDVVPVLQASGEDATASALLDRTEQFIRTIPRLSVMGYGIADVAIHALRGDNAKALAALQEAQRAGWRGPYWRYYRDLDPNLASIRNDPKFKAVFADIERDMVRQRAELAARPKDAPLDLGEVPK
jgi:tetratricopeptide (TPR) repeat protein